MQAMIEWANSLYAGFPLLFLGIWGRFAYIVGLVLVVCSFGGFTLRPNGRWGLGRERTRWDAGALSSVALTIVLVMGAGYLGSSIVLVRGAQTLESLKDAMMFVCIVLFGYPALIGGLVAYVLSDLIEGVPPQLLWRWAECMPMIPAYQWVAHQFIGRNPDFFKLRTWGGYALFVFAFMLLYPPLWGYACGPRSGVFPPQISYYQITPAVFLTFAITWIIAPVLMLGALPLARRLGLFWADVPGRVRQRPMRSATWTWESGHGALHAASIGSNPGLPIRLLIAVPFVALVLLMVGLVAFLSLRSGEDAAQRLAERVSEGLTRSIILQADRLPASVVAADGEARQRALADLLGNAGLGPHEFAFIVDANGFVVQAPQTVVATADSPQSAMIVEAALRTMREQFGPPYAIAEPRSVRFPILSMDPFGVETWLARVTPYRHAGARDGWWIVTAMPESGYLGAIREGNSRAAMVITAALLVAVLLAVFLADRVTNPLRRIARSAQAMGRGDLSQRVRGSGLEELESLADTFNSMARRLQDSFDEIRTGQEKLRAVLDISPLPIAWANGRGEIEFWNRKAGELFGYAPEEIDTLEKWFLRAYPDPAYRRQVIERWDASHAADGSIHRGEYEITCKDGRVITAEVLGTRLGDLTLAVFNDISHRKLAEDELRRHRDHLEELVAARTTQLQSVLLLNDQAMDLTRSGYWTSAGDDPGFYRSSPRCAEIFGDPPVDDWRYSIAHWRSCIAAVDPVLADAAEASLRTASAGASAHYDATYPYLRPADGKVVWIHALGTVANNPVSGVPEMYGAVQDITDIVEARRALEEARSAAEAANRAKSAFLANMSHEIRTPMNAILGMSHLALRGSADPQQSEYLEKIQRAGQHLLSIINDILDISKIEAGKLTVEDSQFALATLLDDVRNVVADKAAAKGLQLSSEVAADVPAHLVGDRLRLGQVLINFATNAVKFTEQGGVRVAVAVAGRGEQGATLRFAVEDTGMGLSRDQIDLVFNAFQQGDSSTTRRYGGTGLGLAISRNLVCLMGGEVGVESEPGRGSTFWFTVPLGIDQRVPAVSSDVDGTPMPSAASIAALHGVRVLLAEDNEFNQEVARTILADAGVHVDVAPDGRAAVEMARMHRYDAVLMDIQMPMMDGVAAAREIRRSSLRPELPIIAMTANVMQEDCTRCRDAGMDDFVGKPVDPGHLLEVLLRWIAPDRMDPADDGN